mgnify:CR=1 FL=1
MAKRPTRLRFTEDDLADSHVKKAATVQIRRLIGLKKRQTNWLLKRQSRS